MEERLTEETASLYFICSTRICCWCSRCFTLVCTAHSREPTSMIRFCIRLSTLYIQVYQSCGTLFMIGSTQSRLSWIIHSCTKSDLRTNASVDSYLPGGISTLDGNPWSFSSCLVGRWTMHQVSVSQLETYSSQAKTGT